MSSKLVKMSMVGVIILMSYIKIVSATVITVGQSGADYDNFDDALDAAVNNDTVQFIDSETYSTTNAPSKVLSGFTVESVIGERATLYFANATGYSGNNWGMLIDGSDFTLNNMVIKSDRKYAIYSGTELVNPIITNVYFVMTEVTSGPVGVVTADGMDISYCTFYGAGNTSVGGYGISWSADTTITVNHCSFDNHMTGIYNGSGNASTLSVSNSVFGNWYDSKWMGGFTIDAVTATATEDYNVSYGPRVFVRSGDLPKVTSGGHSVKAGTYDAVFTGNTLNGDWTVASGLYNAASDGTTIGAWQFVPEIPKGTIIIIE